MIETAILVILVAYFAVGFVVWATISLYDEESVPIVGFLWPLLVLGAIYEVALWVRRRLT